MKVEMVFLSGVEQCQPALPTDCIQTGVEELGLGREKALGQVASSKATPWVVARAAVCWLVEMVEEHITTAEYMVVKNRLRMTLRELEGTELQPVKLVSRAWFFGGHSDDLVSHGVRQGDYLVTVNSHIQRLRLKPGEHRTENMSPWTLHCPHPKQRATSEVYLIRTCTQFKKEGGKVVMNTFTKPHSCLISKGFKADDMPDSSSRKLDQPEGELSRWEENPLFSELKVDCNRNRKWLQEDFTDNYVIGSTDTTLELEITDNTTVPNVSNLEVENEVCGEYIESDTRHTETKHNSEVALIRPCTQFKEEGGKVLMNTFTKPHSCLMSRRVEDYEMPDLSSLKLDQPEGELSRVEENPLFSELNKVDCIRDRKWLQEDFNDNYVIGSTDTTLEWEETDNRTVPNVSNLKVENEECWEHIESDIHTENEHNSDVDLVGLKLPEATPKILIESSHEGVPVPCSKQTPACSESDETDRRAFNSSHELGVRALTKQKLRKTNTHSEYKDFIIEMSSDWAVTRGNRRKVMCKICSQNPSHRSRSGGVLLRSSFRRHMEKVHRNDMCVCSSCGLGFDTTVFYPHQTTCDGGMSDVDESIGEDFTILNTS